MAELKTKPTGMSVAAFLEKIEPERRPDCEALIRIMSEAADAPPQMWGEAIVGFGSYHYKYSSGREADWFLAGFSPRKKDLTLYLMSGFEAFPDLLARLGRYKTGRSCLYVRKLADVDMKVLERLIRASVETTRAAWD